MVHFRVNTSSDGADLASNVVIPRSQVPRGCCCGRSLPDNGDGGLVLCQLLMLRSRVVIGLVGSDY